jgi:hypothetical protein
MKIDITPETIAFLRNSNQWFDEASFSAVLETLTSIVIAQAPRWAEEVYSVLLLEGNEQFSIDQVQALWLLYFDTGYESRQIENNLWLYGDSASVAYFSTPTVPLSDLPEIQTVLRNAEQKQASVLFFSKPGTQLGTDPLTLAFAKKLQYTALYGTPSIDKSVGSMVLQFTWTNFTNSDSIFTPQYTDNLTQNTILYLEGKNLLSTFWLTDTQFSLWFPLLLGQAVPWVDTLLSADQISALYEAFNKQLGIILNVTESTLGVGLHLRLWSPGAYESLLALQPMRRMLATWFMWSWSVTESDTPDSRTLSIDLPTSGGAEEALTTGEDMLASFSLPLITIAKDTASTTLSILPTETEWTQLPSDLIYSAESLMTFRYDANPIMQMAGVNPIIGNLVGQMEMLWTWAILGQLHLDSDEQQVIVTFETK